MATPIVPAPAMPNGVQSGTQVVLAQETDAWLTHVLKRAQADGGHPKTRMDNSLRHQRFLTSLLSSPEAIWMLCSIMLSRAPDAERCQTSDPVQESLHFDQLVHIEARVVCINSLTEKTILFKPTDDTLTRLRNHKDILWENFKASRYYFPTMDTGALDFMEGNGSGELPVLYSGRVKSQINSMFDSFAPISIQQIILQHQPELAQTESLQLTASTASIEWPNLSAASTLPPPYFISSYPQAGHDGSTSWAAPAQINAWGPNFVLEFNGAPVYNMFGGNLETNGYEESGQ
ncbi:hypothetical protein F4604DRAFT_1918648 [Suillus subluteus]|nr:hypothetical protein F4604DRAFT_1918648 [Suillus subluteus]